jgi:hypothetical protein
LAKNRDFINNRAVGCPFWPGRNSQLVKSPVYDNYDSSRRRPLGLYLLSNLRLIILLRQIAHIFSFTFSTFIEIDPTSSPVVNNSRQTNDIDRHIYSARIESNLSDAMETVFKNMPRFRWAVSKARQDIPERSGFASDFHRRSCSRLQRQARRSNSD